MNFDILLAKLPIVGIVFERSYAFWRSHIAVANATHIAFGSGLVLIFSAEFFVVGLVLLVATAVMHIIAFVAGG
ncbi:MAG: hypothetical protein AAB533_00035 [Patescibacteria group bacterium]